MTVLVPIDGSDPCLDALEFALEQNDDTEIRLLHVVNPVMGLYGGDAYYNYEEIIEEGKEAAEELFDEARAIADEHDRELTSEAIVGDPAREIVDYVTEEDIDQVIIGSHGRAGVSRLLLGSVAETVVRRAPVPVTVVR